MSLGTTRAVVRLRNSADEAVLLKRLALLFDEIHYVRPLSTSLSKAALADESRYRTDGKGGLEIVDFNYYRDFEHGAELLSLDPELDETLSALDEAGVAVHCGRELQTVETDKSYASVRKALIAQDTSDEQWKALTGTDDLSAELARLDVERDDTGETDYWWFLEEPPAVRYSDAITSTSRLASTVGAAPLFTDDYRPLLAHRYEQFKSGLHALSKHDPSLGDLGGFDSRFGEVAFGVANAVFSSESLSSRSVDDILRFRSEMDQARRQLVSRDLTDLTGLIGDNPWNRSSRDEVSKYISGKLAGDVATFDVASTGTWEKLYGSLVVRAGGVGQAAGFGGGLGGIAGNVVPHTSAWGMVLAGALAGTAKELPGLMRDVVDAVLESRARDRTGVAYIAKLNS